MGVWGGGQNDRTSPLCKGRWRTLHRAVVLLCCCLQDTQFLTTELQTLAKFGCGTRLRVPQSGKKESFLGQQNRQTPRQLPQEEAGPAPTNQCCTAGYLSPQADAPHQKGEDSLSSCKESNDTRL